ncbi:MAG: mechanosensitive ion channel family protein [Nocardiopsaceae bacterium]|nr:mechanosensitive ion channel family protein [Nocardiopsaceae bacterium]
MSLDLWIAAATSLAFGVIVALAARAAVRRLRHRAERTDWYLDDLVLNLLGSAVPWCAVLLGLWAALFSLPLKHGWRVDSDHALLGAIVIVITIAVARTAGAAVQSRAMAHSGTSGSATIFVNITRVIVFALGLLLLLNSLGIAITPLLTALGVGGLAVALALQDTLSNLFAGVHILASHQIQPGSYILLDNGMEGYIEDTNWRNTTIRQTSNNVVVVPNATLASSIVTNYHQPDQQMSVSVVVGVAYDSDLERVEQVSIDVGREVMREVDGAVPDFEPFVRFTDFGDSSINFSVSLRAAEASKRGLVTHEFIKRLHRRYQAEEIDIPYPVITLTHSDRVDSRELALATAERQLD